MRFRRLIRSHYRAGMAREPGRETLLVIPVEAVARKLAELDVVWRVGVDEVLRRYLDRLEITDGESPSPERLDVRGEVSRVADRPIPSERYVELPASVEAAQPVVSGAVEVVEQLGRLAGPAPAAGHQAVEFVPVPVVELALVAHRNPGHEAALEVAIEVDGMRVHVVEQRPGGIQAERNRESAAERLDQPSTGVLAPQRPQARHEPALAACPFQRRLERGPAQTVAIAGGCGGGQCPEPNM